jgi:formylglycine-generating enzyme required for sulfatase activity
MVVIPGPVKVRMGAPLTEKGRRPDELLHQKGIGRTFAIAATPVTKRQFRRFWPTFTHVEMQRYPGPSCPIGGVSWHNAAAYCNWLSKREGISPDQWCYETDSKGQVTNLKAKYLSLTGYRLPTEAELEYATRAGAVTSRYYGETEELLPKYAWYLKNSGERTWPVGSKKPNDLGLFDTHGNIWCWCLDRYQAYPQGEGVVEDNEDSLIINNQQSRVMRGGSFIDRAVNLRSADRHWYAPEDHTSNVGFRPARTITP